MHLFHCLKSLNSNFCCCNGNGNLHYRPRFKAVLDILENIKVKTTVLGGTFYHHVVKVNCFSYPKDNTVNCILGSVARCLGSEKRN